MVLEVKTKHDGQAEEHAPSHYDANLRAWLQTPVVSFHVSSDSLRDYHIARVSGLVDRVHLHIACTIDHCSRIVATLS
jgi:hypothetical protein